MATTPTSELATFLSCERKEGYSYPDARRIARRIRRASDDVVVVYHCEICKLWHVGSDSEKPMRNAQKHRTHKRRGRGRQVRG